MEALKKESAEIVLRNFTLADVPILCREAFPNQSPEQVQAWIAQWNTKQFQGRFFEMFAVLADGKIVGTISLYQHTEDVISIGPEIFKSDRRCGYGKAAMRIACEIAEKHGFRVVSQQIRVDNTASIAMHSSLGFETDGAVVINAKGNRVMVYRKKLI